jgi:hypothetical protein
MQYNAGYNVALRICGSKIYHPSSSPPAPSDLIDLIRRLFLVPEASGHTSLFLASVGCELPRRRLDARTGLLSFLELDDLKSDGEVDLSARSVSADKGDLGEGDIEGEKDVSFRAGNDRVEREERMKKGKETYWRALPVLQEVDVIVDGGNGDREVFEVEERLGKVKLDDVLRDTRKHRKAGTSRRSAEFYKPLSCACGERNERLTCFPTRIFFRFSLTAVQAFLCATVHSPSSGSPSSSSSSSSSSASFLERETISFNAAAERSGLGAREDGSQLGREDAEPAERLRKGVVERRGELPMQAKSHALEGAQERMSTWEERTYRAQGLSA